MSEQEIINQDFKNNYQYNPETGELTRVRHHYFTSIKPFVLTDVDGFGHIKFKHKYKHYKAHRVAWFLYYGKWPTKIIDHINGVPNDNRIVNLREVTLSQNCMNTKANRERKMCGISKIKHLKTRIWAARSFLNGKRIDLGRFDTQEEAQNAVMDFLKKNDPDSYIVVKGIKDGIAS